MSTALVCFGLGLPLLGACGESSTENGNGDGGSGGSGGSSSSSSSSSSGSGLADGECRTDDDCDTENWESCFYPGAPNCGACWGGDHPCSSDEECEPQLGPGYVCGPLEPGPCICGDGDCIPACTGDGDCATLAEECGTDGHCTLRTCSVDGDCGNPAVRCAPGGNCVVFECDTDGECDGNFECTDTYQCHRKTCTSDAECEGYCVKSSCFDTPGTCQEMAA